MRFVLDTAIVSRYLEFGMNEHQHAHRRPKMFDDILCILYVTGKKGFELIAFISRPLKYGIRKLANKITSSDDAFIVICKKRKILAIAQDKGLSIIKWIPLVVRKWSS